MALVGELGASYVSRFIRVVLNAISGRIHSDCIQSDVTVKILLDLMHLSEEYWVVISLWFFFFIHVRNVGVNFVVDTAAYTVTFLVLFHHIWHCKQLFSFYLHIHVAFDLLFEKGYQRFSIVTLFRTFFLYTKITIATLNALFKRSN